MPVERRGPPHDGHDAVGQRKLEETLRCPRPTSAAPAREATAACSARRRDARASDARMRRATQPRDLRAPARRPASPRPASRSAGCSRCRRRSSASRVPRHPRPRAAGLRRCGRWPRAAGSSAAVQACPRRRCPSAPRSIDHAVEVARRVLAHMTPTRAYGAVAARDRRHPGEAFRRGLGAEVELDVAGVRGRQFRLRRVEEDRGPVRGRVVDAARIVRRTPARTREHGPLNRRRSRPTRNRRRSSTRRTRVPQRIRAPAPTARSASRASNIARSITTASTRFGR